jgi:hypothetical protein
MLRLVAIALLLANAAYYAWTQGFLAGLGLAPAQQSEPERMKAQIEPGTLRLLNGPRAEQAAQTTPEPPQSPPADEPAPLAATPAVSCWQASGFTPAQAGVLRSALGSTGLPEDQWQLNEVKSSGRWVVYMGRFNDEQMEKKKGELRELKIEFREVNLPSTGPGLALGTFSSEESVQQALKDVARKGVRTARAAVERPETVTMTLRLPAITDEQRTRVEGVGPALAGKPLERCD